MPSTPAQRVNHKRATKALWLAYELRDHVHAIKSEFPTAAARLDEAVKALLAAARQAQSGK